MRADAIKALEQNLGPHWDAPNAPGPGAVDELAACALALGLCA
jgi:hypothetical protein